MTFEYRLAVTNTALKGKYFFLNDKEWMTYEQLLYVMNEPMSYDKMTFRIERRLKRENKNC